ncbi:MAG: ZIP family metal transporter, partial [Chloroflexi bacterium]|nr:ZIP family metal transporter [Chloroflexota bacterium]
FLAGGAFLAAIDKVLPHLHLGLPKGQAEGIKTQWQRSILLVMAITLHNLPEGLAVGVAFGAIGTEHSVSTLGAAVALAIGIGLQNFPEGMAVSIPLRREGFQRSEAFWAGQASGIVEPIGGLLGALAVQLVTPILPYALAFAAGAMIFVVIEELIPESQQGHNTDLATGFTLFGFVVMMVMDVALG